MSLRYQDFLNKAVDESIKGATESYGKRVDSRGRAMIEGSLAGLNACRDLSPPQLAALLERAKKVHHMSMHRTVIERYWRINCFMHEVEWICNVVSVALVNQGIEPIIQPTMRAAMLASRITQESVDSN